MKLLIIEDDNDIVDVISLTFKMRWQGANIVSANRGQKGLEMVETESPDAVILDLGLPDISGFDVLKQIRAFSDVPVLILTVRGDESDIVRGLEWGADDYVTKPFRQLELMSRVAALVRRKHPGSVDSPISYGKFHFDPSTGQLTYGDKKVSLTRTESSILKHLMLNPGNVLTYTSLAEEVWGQDYPDAVESLRVYVRRLREKVETDPGSPQIIINKPGIGYMIQEPQ